MAGRVELRPLRWADAPPPKNRSGRGAHYDALVNELRAQPGRWCVVAELPQTGSASSVVAGLKKRGCDARAHKNGDVTEVWASWPGDQVDDEPVESPDEAWLSMVAAAGAVVSEVEKLPPSTRGSAVVEVMERLDVDEDEALSLVAEARKRGLAPASADGRKRGK